MFSATKVSAPARVLVRIRRAQRFAAIVALSCWLVTPAMAQKEVLVGWWTSIGNSSAWPGYASNGSNFLHFSGATYSTPAQVTAALDAAQSLGMKVSISMTRTEHTSWSWTASQFTSFVNSIKAHPAIWGWYLADEPELASDPATAHYRLLTNPGYYPLVKAADPNRPAWLVLSGSTRSGWNDVSDIVAVDIYPSYGAAEFENSQLRNSYDTWRQGLDWAQNYNKSPFVAVVQGFGSGHGLWDDLTLAEMKYHVLTAVVQGADKILFWCDEWANSWTMNVANTVIRMIHDMRSEMANGIVNDPAIAVSQPTSNLAYNHGASGDRHVILAVNIANRSSRAGATLSNVQFTLPAGLRPSQVEVLDEGRTIPVTNGVFTDTFSPFQVHAYVFTASASTVVQVAAPTITPNGGTFSGSQTITLATATPGASIRYSLDGSTPTLAYSGPLVLTQSATVKAQAFAPGMTNSAISTAQFTAQAEAPAISPNGGTFTAPQSVTLSTRMPGTSIRYSLDGSAPTLLYSNPITVSQSATVRAQATAAGMADSTISTAGFTISVPAQVAAPTITPPGGAFTGSVTVSLATPTPGATIRYSLDGGTPSLTYSGPFPLPSSAVVRAQAVASGMTASSIVSAQFTVTAAVTPLSISITSPDDGATLARQPFTFSAQASAGVRSVQWYLDGAPLGAPVTVAPSFSVVLDLGTLRGRGWHTVTATASDGAGGAVTSAPVRFRLNSSH